ncbi:lipopolysaccharide biosynthesis protein [Cylindrospermum sp. NIES-4074]|nr:lipopolysaccharide biosynthesis protein [Cylindrospermum sp. NIES-4074]
MKSQKSFVGIETYLQIIQRRWLCAIGISIPVFLISVIPFSFKKSTYEAEGKLLFQGTNPLSSITGLGTEIGRLESVAQTQSNPLTTEIEIIRSLPVVQKTIDKLNLKDNNGNTLNYNNFISQLTIKELERTDILQVSYKHADPVIAAKVVNTLMDAYLEHNISSHRTEAVAARKFIVQQMPKAELIVRQAEAELANFKEKNKVVDLKEEATRALELITELQQQISQNQSQIADVNAQSQDIRKQLNMNSQQAITMTSLSQSSGVQDMLREIQQLESQLAAKRTIFLSNHPEIINLESKQQALKNLLKNRVQEILGKNKPQLNKILQIGALQQQLTAELVRLESTHKGLISQAATLVKLQANYRERLNILPRLDQQHRQLERKVQASQSTYSLLLQKFQESRIAENQNVGNASKIAEAQIPEKAIPSSVMISYVSGSLLAVLAGLTSILLLEARDKSIKTVDEAKELLELTLLGVIPNVNKSPKPTSAKEDLDLSIPKILVRDKPRSPVSEAYRMLRANLKFMSADKELKVIVVTSSVPKEGKSTVAANLAVAMAQIERKVLLIDGDLHRPVQDKIWEITNNQGLSNLIIGQTEIKMAIKKVMDNLDVLTSGVVPPSPASLLDSKRMAALMETFAANYEFVIIDAPSLNVGADAATLGQMADGVLLVVRPGVVNSVNATFAKELLEKSGQNVLGQVVNGVIPKNEPYSYYYFTEDDDSQASMIKDKYISTIKS